MGSVTIAYNAIPCDDSGMHRFFQSCGDTARQFCQNYGHKPFLLVPPNLNNSALLERLEKDTVCVIAAHGSSNAIYNENDEEILSTNTVNYDLKDKTVYTIACACGDRLGEELRRIGVKIFIGYNQNLKIGSDEELFTDCVMSGLNKLLKGDNLNMSRLEMLRTYEDAISSADNNQDKWLLLDNREALVFIGNPSACI